jgi:hypothetical protein
MNDGSFVFAIPLDDPLIELVLEDGMPEVELDERPPLELPVAFDAVVFEPLPYVDDEPIAVLELEPLT